MALGLGLKDAGCQVTIASHPTFKGLIEGRGFEFAPLSVDPRAVVESLARSGNSARGIMKGFKRVVGPALYEAAQEAIAATEDAEGLLISSAAFLGYDVADARDLPAVGLEMAPLIAPTKHFPNALMPAAVGFERGIFGAVGTLYNRSSHFAASQLLWQPFRKTINRIRSELFSLRPHPFLGPLLTPQQNRRLQLYGWSNELLPEPPDWNEDRRVTGYWFLNPGEDWSPPEDLAEFLGSGPPPVCMGFGSSYIENAARIADVFAKTLSSLGQRGVLLGGWGELRGETPHHNVLEIEEAPYSWLLPRTPRLRSSRERRDYTRGAAGEDTQRRGAFLRRSATLGTPSLARKDRTGADSTRQALRRAPGPGRQQDHRRPALQRERGASG